MNREEFLQLVKSYIESDPEAAARVADFVQAGLSSALRKANERAGDMEIAMSVLAARRFKDGDALVLSKLQKWEGRTALNWGWLIEKLQTPSKEESK